MTSTEALNSDMMSIECPQCRGRKTELWTCKVCGNEPNEDGEVNHGRGCYQLSSDGGGTEYPDLDPCSRCEGTGLVPAVECPECSGNRIVSRPNSILYSQSTLLDFCTTCQGAGRVPAVECPNCYGSGEVFFSCIPMISSCDTCVGVGLVSREE